jgi:hypothetical protein
VLTPSLGRLFIANCGCTDGSRRSQGIRTNTFVSQKPSMVTHPYGWISLPIAAFIAA